MSYWSNRRHISLSHGDLYRKNLSCSTINEENVSDDCNSDPFKENKNSLERLKKLERIRERRFRDIKILKKRGAEQFDDYENRFLHDIDEFRNLEKQRITEQLANSHKASHHSREITDLRASIFTGSQPQLQENLLSSSALSSRSSDDSLRNVLADINSHYGHYSKDSEIHQGYHSAFNISPTESFCSVHDLDDNLSFQSHLEETDEWSLRRPRSRASSFSFATDQGNRAIGLSPAQSGSQDNLYGNMPSYSRKNLGFMTPSATSSYEGDAATGERLKQLQERLEHLRNERIRMKQEASSQSRQRRHSTTAGLDSNIPSKVSDYGVSSGSSFGFYPYKSQTHNFSSSDAFTSSYPRRNLGFMTPTAVSAYEDATTTAEHMEQLRERLQSLRDDRNRLNRELNSRQWKHSSSSDSFISDSQGDSLDQLQTVQVGKDYMSATQNKNVLDVKAEIEVGANTQSTETSEDPFDDDVAEDEMMLPISEPGKIHDDVLITKRETTSHIDNETSNSGLFGNMLLNKVNKASVVHESLDFQQNASTNKVTTGASGDTSVVQHYNRDFGLVNQQVDLPSKSSTETYLPEKTSKDSEDSLNFYHHITTTMPMLHHKDIIEGDSNRSSPCSFIETASQASSCTIYYDAEENQTTFSDTDTLSHEDQVEEPLNVTAIELELTANDANIAALDTDSIDQHSHTSMIQSLKTMQQKGESLQDDACAADVTMKRIDFADVAMEVGSKPDEVTLNKESCYLGVAHPVCSMGAHKSVPSEPVQRNNAQIKTEVTEAKPLVTYINNGISSKTLATVKTNTHTVSDSVAAIGTGMGESEQPEISLRESQVQLDRKTAENVSTLSSSILNVKPSGRSENEKEVSASSIQTEKKISSSFSDNVSKTYTSTFSVNIDCHQVDDKRECIEQDLPLHSSHEVSKDAMLNIKDEVDNKVQPQKLRGSATNVSKIAAASGNRIASNECLAVETQQENLVSSIIKRKSKTTDKQDLETSVVGAGFGRNTDLSKSLITSFEKVQNISKTNKTVIQKADVLECMDHTMKNEALENELKFSKDSNQQTTAEMKFDDDNKDLGSECFHYSQEAKTGFEKIPKVGKPVKILSESHGAVQMPVDLKNIGEEHDISGVTETGLAGTKRVLTEPKDNKAQEGLNLDGISSVDIQEMQAKMSEENQSFSKPAEIQITYMTALSVEKDTDISKMAQTRSLMPKDVSLLPGEKKITKRCEKLEEETKVAKSEKALKLDKAGDKGTLKGSETIISRVESPKNVSLKGSTKQLAVKESADLVHMESSSVIKLAEIFNKGQQNVDLLAQKSSGSLHASDDPTKLIFKCSNKISAMKSPFETQRNDVPVNEEDIKPLVKHKTVIPAYQRSPTKKIALLAEENNPFKVQLESIVRNSIQSETITSSSPKVLAVESNIQPVRKNINIDRSSKVSDKRSLENHNKNYGTNVEVFSKSSPKGSEQTANDFVENVDKLEKFLTKEIATTRQNSDKSMAGCIQNKCDGKLMKDFQTAGEKFSVLSTKDHTESALSETAEVATSAKDFHIDVWKLPTSITDKNARKPDGDFSIKVQKMSTSVTPIKDAKKYGENLQTQKLPTLVKFDDSKMDTRTDHIYVQKQLESPTEVSRLDKSFQEEVKIPLTSTLEKYHQNPDEKFLTDIQKSTALLMSETTARSNNRDFQTEVQETVRKDGDYKAESKKFQNLFVNEKAAESLKTIAGICSQIPVVKTGIMKSDVAGETDDNFQTDVLKPEKLTRETTILLKGISDTDFEADDPKAQCCVNNEPGLTNKKSLSKNIITSKVPQPTRREKSAAKAHEEEFPDAGHVTSRTSVLDRIDGQLERDYPKSVDFSINRAQTEMHAVNTPATKQNMKPLAKKRTISSQREDDLQRQPENRDFICTKISEDENKMDAKQFLKEVVISDGDLHIQSSERLLQKGNMQEIKASSFENCLLEERKADGIGEESELPVKKLIGISLKENTNRQVMVSPMKDITTELVSPGKDVHTNISSSSVKDIKLRDTGDSPVKDVAVRKTIKSQIKDGMGSQIAGSIEKDMPKYLFGNSAKAVTKSPEKDVPSRVIPSPVKNITLKSPEEDFPRTVMGSPVKDMTVDSPEKDVSTRIMHSPVKDVTLKSPEEDFPRTIMGSPVKDMTVDSSEKDVSTRIMHSPVKDVTLKSPEEDFPRTVMGSPVKDMTLKSPVKDVTVRKTIKSQIKDGMGSQISGSIEKDMPKYLFGNSAKAVTKSPEKDVPSRVIPSPVKNITLKSPEEDFPRTVMGSPVKDMTVDSPEKDVSTRIMHSPVKDVTLKSPEEDFPRTVMGSPVKDMTVDSPEKDVSTRIMHSPVKDVTLKSPEEDFPRTVMGSPVKDMTLKSPVKDVTVRKTIKSQIKDGMGSQISGSIEKDMPKYLFGNSAKAVTKSPEKDVPSRVIPSPVKNITLKSPEEDFPRTVMGSPVKDMTVDSPEKDVSTRIMHSPVKDVTLKSPEKDLPRTVMGSPVKDMTVDSPEKDVSTRIMQNPVKDITLKSPEEDSPRTVMGSLVKDVTLESPEKNISRKMVGSPEKDVPRGLMHNPVKGMTVKSPLPRTIMGSPEKDVSFRKIVDNPEKNVSLRTMPENPEKGVPVRIMESSLKENTAMQMVTSPVDDVIANLVHSPNKDISKGKVDRQMKSVPIKVVESSKRDSPTKITSSPVEDDTAILVDNPVKNIDTKTIGSPLKVSNVDKTIKNKTERDFISNSGKYGLLEVEQKSEILRNFQERQSDDALNELDLKKSDSSFEVEKINVLSQNAGERNKSVGISTENDYEEIQEPGGTTGKFVDLDVNILKPLHTPRGEMSKSKFEDHELYQGTGHKSASQKMKITKADSSKVTYPNAEVQMLNASDASEFFPYGDFSAEVAEVSESNWSLENTVSSMTSEKGKHNFSNSESILESKDEDFVQRSLRIEATDKQHDLPYMETKHSDHESVKVDSKGKLHIYENVPENSSCMDKPKKINHEEYTKISEHATDNENKFRNSSEPRSDIHALEMQKENPREINNETQEVNLQPSIRKIDEKPINVFLKDSDAEEVVYQLMAQQSNQGFLTNDFMCWESEETDEMDFEKNDESIRRCGKNYACDSAEFPVDHKRNKDANVASPDISQKLDSDYFQFQKRNNRKGKSSTNSSETAIQLSTNKLVTDVQFSKAHTNDDKLPSSTVGSIIHNFETQGFGGENPFSGDSEVFDFDANANEDQRKTNSSDLGSACLDSLNVRTQKPIEKTPLKFSKPQKFEQVAPQEGELTVDMYPTDENVKSMQKLRDSGITQAQYSKKRIMSARGTLTRPLSPGQQTKSPSEHLDFKHKRWKSVDIIDPSDISYDEMKDSSSFQSNTMSRAKSSSIRSLISKLTSKKDKKSKKNLDHQDSKGYVPMDGRNTSKRSPKSRKSSHSSEEPDEGGAQERSSPRTPSSKSRRRLSGSKGKSDDWWWQPASPEKSSLSLTASSDGEKSISARKLLSSAFISGDSEPIDERVHLTSWDPTLLLRELYAVRLADDTVKDVSSQFISMNGYMEKLPMGKKKSTFLKTWKRRYFQARNGWLEYYDMINDEKPSDKVQLMGGTIEDLGNRNLGIDDGRGRYLMLRCPSEKEHDQWLTALKSQTVDNTRATYVKPMLQAPKHPHMNVVVIDLGSMCVRAGLLKDSATLPDLFFPNVVAVNKTTGEHVIGFDAYKPEIRQRSVLVQPVASSKTVDKFKIDMKTLLSVFSAVFRDLGIEPSQYLVMLSIPQNLSIPQKETIMDMLVESCHVCGVCMVAQALLALYSYNTSTGIIVNLGERLEVLPVCDGFVIEAGCFSQPYGAQKVRDSLNATLTERRYSLFSSVEHLIVQYVMEQTCFVSQNFSDMLNKFSENADSFKSTVYLGRFQLPQGTYTNITHDHGTFISPEGLFDSNIWGMDFPSVQGLVRKAIQACPVDSRRHMCRAIYLSGGTSLLPGLANRLEAELIKCANPSLMIEVHSAPQRHHASYIGACALSALPEFEHSCIGKDEWRTQGTHAFKKWQVPM